MSISVLFLNRWSAWDLHTLLPASVKSRWHTSDRPKTSINKMVRSITINFLPFPAPPHPIAYRLFWLHVLAVEDISSTSYVWSSFALSSALNLIDHALPPVTRFRVERERGWASERAKEIVSDEAKIQIKSQILNSLLACCAVVRLNLKVSLDFMLLPTTFLFSWSVSLS